MIGGSKANEFSIFEASNLSLVKTVATGFPSESVNIIRKFRKCLLAGTTDKTLLLIKVSSDLEVGVTLVPFQANCLYDLSVETNYRQKSVYTGFKKRHQNLAKFCLKTSKLDLLCGHTNEVYTVALSKGPSRLIATGSYDQSLVFYNMFTQRVKRRRPSICNDFVSAALFFENERLLFVGTCDTCCFIFCTTSLESRQRISSDMPVYTACISDGYLFFAGSGTVVKLLKLK